MKPKNFFSSSEGMSLKQALEALAVLRDELQRLKKETAQTTMIRDEFLSRISHELRTPLNAIMGTGELLRGAGLNDSQSAYLSMIQASTQQLLHLVNEIFDFSELQDETASPRAEVFPFRETVTPVFNQLSLKAGSKGLRFFTHLDRDLPDLIRGHPRWIMQVISVLADNALKFTAHGEIMIQFAAQDVAREGFTLCLSVTDTGIGIPKDKQEMVFQPFATGHDSKFYDGFGMGLSYAEKLVRKMGGRIWVDSELYLGSTFYVSLPLLTAPRPEIVERPAVDGPFRILLAEDEPINRITTVELLKHQGHHVDAVINGRQALEQLVAAQYDLILMDISMPEMDGLEASRAIRSGELSSIDPNIPIIALTALVMPADRRKCLDAGMDAYVPKPVDVKKLQEVFGQVLSKRELEAIRA